MDGYRAWVVGHKAEDRFFRICEKFQKAGKFPKWLLNITAANSEQDAYGVDAWAHTDVGKIPLQIKSTASARKKFRERPERTKGEFSACVLVTLEESFETIFSRTLMEIGQVRAKRRKSRPAHT